RDEPLPPPAPSPFSTPFPPQTEAPPPPAPAPAPPQPAPLPPQGYQRSIAMSLNGKVLQWIAPICLLLVFVLQFFDWDGLYPGGVAAVTGNAWTAAFGAYSADGDLKTHPYVPDIKEDKHKPGASVLTIFYLILFFPALLVTIAAVAITMVPIKLPLQVEKLLPWRWGVVTAINLIVFLFLGLQVLLGFSLDSRFRDFVDNRMKNEKKETPTTPERKLADVHRGQMMEVEHHTIWLRLAVLLHLAAIASAALMFWLHQRGSHRPLPQLELRW
ncbi:MAG: hypothetical protein ACRELF_18885, partial [Gemmataceae bacterium]